MYVAVVVCRFLIQVCVRVVYCVCLCARARVCMRVREWACIYLFYF